MRARVVALIGLGAALAMVAFRPSGVKATPLTISQALATSFDAARAFQHLERIVAIGPRPAGSTALRQTRAYITRQLDAMGLTVQEQPFTVTTPIGRVEMVNLIVRLPGDRPDRLLIAGHYDTKLMTNATFVGANDGGSSAAFLVELARVLAARPRAFTYELIWFDGEEAFCTGWTDCGTPASPDNTYGSRHYVDAARDAGALPSLRALILVDMIGDRNLTIRRDSNSTPWLVDLVWEAAAGRGHDRVFVGSSTAIEDDHLPFLRAGVPAVDLIDLDYPAWHTPGDTLDQVSANSLQIVGDVLLDALPRIERRLLGR
jgi:glutaminyl-peptide cyclotransferase